MKTPGREPKPPFMRSPRGKEPEEPSKKPPPFRCQDCGEMKRWLINDLCYECYNKEE